MDLRFEEAPDRAYELMREIIKDESLHWPTELVNAKILILIDTKKRMSGEKIVLGRMSKTNDLTRHLTIDDSGEERPAGYDYIMYLDKILWKFTEDADRIRVLRHELKHTSIEDCATPYKLRGHTIEDFYSEVKLNEDDPFWRTRVATMVDSKYEELKNPQGKLPGMG